uniref:Ovule protein n=1 Tax=Caenorhabditis tropicalis TaxID=1561998 RepID=A0A1I7USP1_9PELO
MVHKTSGEMTSSLVERVCIRVVWNENFQFWNLEFGQKIFYGIWNLEFGQKNMEFGIWNMEFGIWIPYNSGVYGKPSSVVIDPTDSIQKVTPSPPSLERRNS